MPESSRPHCAVCDRSFRSVDLIPFDLVREAITRLIREDSPEWGPGSGICHPDLNRYRAHYVERLLTEEMGELTQTEQEVVRGIERHQILATDVDRELDREATFGEHVSDRFAEIGGSWRFVLTFIGFLVIWIAINSWVLLSKPFDPYPFILLNLILSCIAALQAPVIMMSQNRQESKDRKRNEHDYQVNLKAELEIRMLSERIDRLLSHQWQRLLEIQQIQVDLISQVSGPRRSYDDDESSS